MSVATHSPRKMSISRNNAVSVKSVICMVGLPARGKTYISKKLARYLNWIGVNTKVFNVGSYRRKATTVAFQSHEFFLSTNENAMKFRQHIAEVALKDAIGFLEGEGDVAIFDATNITTERRQMVYETVKAHNFQSLFIESICDNPDLISANIADVKIHGPDYEGMNKDEAMEDFMHRIHHYEEQYMPLCEEKEAHLSFMKIFNAGERLVINRARGNLQSRIGYWLMNIHITPRSIYLTRHGESELNTLGRIGGDSSLSDRGKRYADALAKYINDMNIPDMRVWTSWFKRTIETAGGIQAPQERWKALNEIDAGICEEMTYDEIKAQFPLDYAARERNKLTYRYPGGESYEDLISRLEAVIMELERQGNVLLVGHQAVLRCLLCYFQEKPLEELPYVKVPLHTLIKLTPVAYGCEVELIPFGIDAVDTHRPKLEMSDEEKAKASLNTERLIEKLSDSTVQQLKIRDQDKVIPQVGSPRIMID